MIMIWLFLSKLYQTVARHEIVIWTSLWCVWIVSLSFREQSTQWDILCHGAGLFVTCLPQAGLWNSDNPPKLLLSNWEDEAARESERESKRERGVLYSKVILASAPWGDCCGQIGSPAVWECVPKADSKSTTENSHLSPNNTSFR